MHLCPTDICIDSSDIFIANILSEKRGNYKLRLNRSIEQKER